MSVPFMMMSSIINGPPTSDIRPLRCSKAPKGWYCISYYGHEGPCPAWPTRWTRIKAGLMGVRFPR